MILQLWFSVASTARLGVLACGVTLLVIFRAAGLTMIVYYSNIKTCP